MPEVRMTIEEYLALINPDGSFKQERPTKKTIVVTPKRKKPGKAAKGLGQAMKEANRRLRTKNGKLRKGKTQADVARLAHKIRRQKYA